MDLESPGVTCRNKGGGKSRLQPPEELEIFAALTLERRFGRRMRRDRRSGTQRMWDRDRRQGREQTGYPLELASAKGTMGVESGMTELLEKAVAAAATRPADEQDALASLLLSELEAEDRWAEVLRKDPAKLRRLAEEAIEEIRAVGSRSWIQTVCEILHDGPVLGSATVIASAGSEACARSL
jgi:hypothetical protein